MSHIETEHGGEIRAKGTNPARYVHRVLLEFDGVFQEGGRLILFATRPTAVAVIELRQDSGGFYSVITAFEKKTPRGSHAG